MNKFQPITWKDKGVIRYGVMTDEVAFGVLAVSTDTPNISTYVLEPHKVRDKAECLVIWKTLGISNEVLTSYGWEIGNYKSTFDLHLAALDAIGGDIDLMWVKAKP